MWHIGQVKPHFGTVNKLKPQTLNILISLNFHFQHLVSVATKEKQKRGDNIHVYPPD